MVRPSLFGASLAWAVPILAEAAALGRSIAFAWLIGPEELGQAMILALTLRLVEMSSDLGFDRLLVQAPDGDSLELQAGLHGASVLRAIAAALAMLALAPIAASVFRDGPALSSYALLAVVPLIRGFAHLDFRRAERSFDYQKMSVVEAGATLTMILSIGPGIWAFEDHRAMSVALIAHAATYTVLSHFVAERHYAVSFDRYVLLRCWTFGAPLILNAVLLFLTFYADRLLVAWAYDWASVALYGVVLQLALLPAQIIGRAASSLVLPRLRLALSKETLQLVWPPLLRSYVMLAATVGMGFALAAPYLIALVYGDALRPDYLLASAVAGAAVFRVIRTPYSQLAIVLGRTGDPARANLFRAFALIPAFGCATAGLPLAAVGCAAALGEAAATFKAHQLSQRAPQTFAAGEKFA